MGGYDLYGNYYASSRDAMNAELAQMAEIDAAHAQRSIQEQGAELGQLYADNERLSRLLSAVCKKLGLDEEALLESNYSGEPYDVVITRRKGEVTHD